MMNKKEDFDDNDELRPYKTDKISDWSTWVKVFIIKAWTAGTVFFFIYFSSTVFSIMPNPLDRFFVVGLVLILLNEFFINLIIKFMQRDDFSMEDYAMFVNNKWSLVYNIFYIMLVVAVTIAIGVLLISMGISLSVLFYPSEPAGWEPIMFGLLYYGVDTTFIGIKRIIRNKKKGGQ